MIRLEFDPLMFPLGNFDLNFVFNFLDTSFSSTSVPRNFSILMSKTFITMNRLAAKKINSVAPLEICFLFNSKSFKLIILASPFLHSKQWNKFNFEILASFPSPIETSSTSWTDSSPGKSILSTAWNITAFHSNPLIVAKLLCFKY